MNLPKCSLSLLLSLSYSLSLSLLDMRSPLAGSREECVAGQQTGVGLPHTRRETATAVPTEEQKKPNKSLEPLDFDTRVHTKLAT